MLAQVSPSTYTDKRLRFNVRYQAGFTDKDIEKHKMSYLLGQLVVNTVEFKHRLLSLPLLRRGKLTKLEVYALIMSGSEELDKTVDHEVDVHVEMYHEDNKVVGWTKPSVVWTKVNRKFFNQYNYAQVFGNLWHEWLHKLGFDHNSASDHNSVVYAVGYLARDMVNELVKGATFTDVWTGLPINASHVNATPVPAEFPTKPTSTPTPVYKVVCTRSWKTLWLRKICRKVLL